VGSRPRLHDLAPTGPENRARKAGGKTRRRTVSNPNEQVAGVVQKLACIPEHGKNRTGDDNAEDLSEAVEKEVIVAARQKEPE